MARGLLTAWSYSRLQTYEACPLKARFTYIDKLAPPPSRAMINGQEAHGQAETFLKGGEYPYHPAWDHATWGTLLTTLLEQEFIPEQQVAFDKDWSVVAWYAPEAWCRMVFDASKEEKKVVHVIDYKTGRFSDQHAEQAELYAVGAAYLFPAARMVHAEFWYLDNGEIHEFDFKKSEIPDLTGSWEVRGNAMCGDTIFAPNPGYACGMYGGCPFASNKGGQCEYNSRGVAK